MMSPVGPLLEKSSVDLLSDNKILRKAARGEILRITNNFVSPPFIHENELKNYPRWKQLSIDIFNTIYHNKFPYEINQNKAGSIHGRYRNFVQPPVSQRQSDPTKAGYVINMAHCARSDGNLQPLIDQINLIRNEAFGTNPEESWLEADDRLRLVIGVNVRYSPHSPENKSFKNYIHRLQALATSTISFAPFCWTAAYKRKDASGPVHVKVVKRYLRLIAEGNLAAAQTSVISLGKPHTVPMQIIREEIKNHPQTYDHLAALNSESEFRDLGLITADDDGLCLNTENRGWISQYDLLLKEHPHLEYASTGYTMRDNDYNFYQIATELDLRVRRAIGGYIPEANALIRIYAPIANGLRRFTFLRDNPSVRGLGLESLGITESLHLTYRDVGTKFIFGKVGAIVTTAARVELPSHIPCHLDSNQLLISKNLRSFRGFSMSSLHPTTGFAPSLLRQFPGKSGQHNNKFVAAIFTSLDPIELSKTFATWNIIYKPYVNELINLFNEKYNDNAVNFDFDVRALNLIVQNSEALSEGSLTLDESFRYLINKHLEWQFSKLWHASECLKREGFTNEQILYIVDRSVKGGFAIHEYLQKLIRG